MGLRGSLDLHAGRLGLTGSSPRSHIAAAAMAMAARTRCGLTVGAATVSSGSGVARAPQLRSTLGFGGASDGTGRLPAYGTGRLCPDGGGSVLGYAALNPNDMGSNPGDSTIRPNIAQGATFGNYIVKQTASFW